EKPRSATRDEPEANWPQTRSEHIESSTLSEIVLMPWLQRTIECYLEHGTSQT
ncbi:hypothetical protein GW17_00040817, partial [Ensete ventricosum]